MLPAIYNLEPMVRGDQWRGIDQIGPLTFAGVAPKSPCVAASMQFRRTAGNRNLGHSIASGSGIEIVDADAWVFRIPPQALPLDEGVWCYQFQTVAADADGLPKTYLEGTIEISEDTNR
ncbi:hypothetical protein JIN85_16940 [Luteolibacter pohnpeiensis]|uniref:Uncharacterized protein n=1 Tax=Luteolibacter pohnpeiensis TaxID=454153 RepID=A0A934SDY2_9BACT|nr:hypothetical protein [Luteolibacter pohnpeiensis]MBK1884109.1 hypothetical protein [Luteolibacter pohnpeiensis]